MEAGFIRTAESPLKTLERSRVNPQSGQGFPVILRKAHCHKSGSNLFITGDIKGNSRIYII